ncbi:MAG: oligosaccharide flippase family protein [Chitinophagales bacterium]
MRKKFIANIGFLLLLNLLVKPFWILGIDRSVQNDVGPDVYGVYFALFNFSYLFQMILDFGINNFNNRLVSQDPARLGIYLISTLAVKVILTVVYIIVLFIAAIGINFNNDQLELLGSLMMMQILMSFYSFLRSNISALHLFKTDAVLSVLDKLITSVICALILWTSVFKFPISVNSFVWAQISGYISGLIVALAVILKQHITIKWKIDLSLIREIFKKSFPYALLGFLMTAYYRVDGVMIERILKTDGAYQAGIYASAFRLLDALNIIGFLFAGLLLPMFSRMIEIKENIKPLLDLGYKLMLLFCAASGITCIFYRLDIMQLLYETGDIYSASIFGWLMISFICISITYIYGSLITAQGNIRKLNLISLAGFLLNILLNFILIPQYKALGSAMATVASQSLILVAHIYISNRLFAIPFAEKKWMHSLIFITLVILINWAIGEINTTWYYKFVLSGILSTMSAIPAGLFSLKELTMSIPPLLRGIRKNQ